MLKSGLAVAVLAVGLSARAEPAQTLFTPDLTVGASLGTIFSRAIAVTAPGYDAKVRRVSGTGDYRVTDRNPLRPVFDMDYLYDGRPAGKGKVEIDLRTGENCFEGKCAIDTSASGLLFNPFLWGKPPAKLKVGDHWQVTLGQPWELGPAGQQTVTVLAIEGDAVTLERKGESSGPLDGEAKTIDLTSDGKTTSFSLTPGLARWSGYTLFRAGRVVSDELLVRRDLTLTGADGKTVPAVERQYILLNAAPPGAPLS
ncbi:MAG TPA: hypothetical protein VKP60_07360 [Magnetospirillaceae bacterium]|nr:hypothetical protein [Magnetospirillaceae bacterium]